MRVTPNPSVFLLKSSPVKGREQHEQKCERMGELRHAVWANTQSRVSFTLKVHPLFHEEAHCLRLLSLYMLPKLYPSTPLKPGTSKAFDFYFMTHVTSVSPLRLQLLFSLWHASAEHYNPLYDKVIKKSKLQLKCFGKKKLNKRYLKLLKK